MAKEQAKIVLKDYIAYAISILVVVVSTSLVILLPVSDTIKTYFSLPGILGLFSLLVQGWRDQIAHERARELQQSQNNFELSIASHMANVVFDKQVEFCEQYSQTLYAFVQEMFITGPTKEALTCAADLQKIRLQYSPWISLNLVQKLTPYEAALREIGGIRQMEEIHARQKQGGLDSGLIKKMYDVFMEFLGISEKDIKASAPDAILEHLKDILNISDLENLRRKAIEMAIHNKG